MPAYKDYAGDIHNSGVHLLGLINEILDLSRIEAGRYELNEEAVSLVHVVGECSHLLQMRARSRSIAIHDVFETDMPRLWADERAVRQICLNLLGNAIKFTPQGGEIWLKVGWTASGGQYISVKDTGPGIPEEEIPIVLASFGQGSNSIKSAEQGAGLGLPIAKSLIDLHAGTFTLKSKLRIGTEVVVTFPPERVMSALAPLSEPAPSIQTQQPQTEAAASPPRRHQGPAHCGGCSGSARKLPASSRSRRLPSVRRSLSCAPHLTATTHGRHRDPLQQGVRGRPGLDALRRLRAHHRRDRRLDRLHRRRALAHHGGTAATPGDAARERDDPRRCDLKDDSVRRLLWILLAILIAVLFALVVQQDGTLAGLSQYDFSSLTTKLVALVFVCVLVLALFRQRFSHALESALIWVLIALLLAIGYTYRFELRDVAERVLAELIPGRAATRGRTVEIARGPGGSFFVTVQINEARASMVLDTGASAVVLTQEAAKAAGLPLEVLNYSVNVDTANGRARAAPVTLDRVSVGGITERSVPALIAQPGQLRVNLLGMSFLNRLQSWEVRGDKLILRGSP